MSEKKVKSQKDRRAVITQSLAARSFLYFSDFITDAEYDKIQQRIRKYQDKHQVGISDKQVHSVNFKYTGD